LPHAARAIVFVEAGRPRAVDGLGLADALEAVGVTPRDCAVDRLFHHLRQPGRVHIVLHKILRGHAIHRLGNPVAISVAAVYCPEKYFLLSPVALRHYSGNSMTTGSWQIAQTGYALH